MPKQPGHRHSSKLLREVVAAVVPADACERYMPFARELYVSFHGSRKQGTVPRRACVRLGAVQSPFSPDFSRRTKLVVQKWFVRGLSGHLMWLIGERMLGRMYPEARPYYRPN
ncbi:MAG TPA: hypothetical protein VMH22_02345 [bacterium]|nr:hypothetical protein [bacterium]